MEDEDGACNTGLCLSLGLGGYVPKKKKQQIRETNQVVGRCLDLPFELCPRGDQETIHNTAADQEEENGLFRVKRMDLDNANNNSTKKLRLTKDQSALLEESFKLHITLNPSQKQSLAEKLNLRTRQVEVWFQNRRARTKLKQTKVDCEFLKKCCENLRDENRRLKKELQELRALKFGMTATTTMPSPLFIQLSKTTAMSAAETTATTCSSCQKRFKANDANSINNNKNKNNSKHSKLERVALDCYVG